MDEETLVLLYECLHMKFRRKENEMASFHSLFYNFLDDIIAYRNYTKSYEELMFTGNYIKTTELFPQYKLAEFIYHSYIADSFYDYSTNMDIIETLFHFLDKNQQQIYYDAVGVHYKNESRYDKALYYFDMAAVYGYETATALMCYHKALLLTKTGCLIESLECANQAKAMFDKAMNYDRSLLCSGTIAMISARLGLYEEAIKTYKKCIAYMKSPNMSKDLMRASNNLCWTYLLSQQYEQVIVSANETLALKRNHVPSFFYKAYAYDKLNEKFKSKESIKRAKSLASNASCTPYMAAIVDAFYTLLSEQKGISTKIKKLNLALQQAEKCNDYQLELFVLNMIVETYQEYGDYQEAFAYQSKMIQIYEKRK